jgi:tetratricopeptide (TPR) repeat protein
MRLLVPSTLVLLLSTSVFAQAPATGTTPTPTGDKSTDARALFNEANSHFAVGEFNEAAENYQAAYKLRPDPALLYNAAQAFRLGGKSEKALVLYRNYVALYPKQRNIEEVKKQIVSLQEVVAAQEKTKTAPPIDTAEPKPLPPGTTPPPTQPPVAAAPPPPPPPPPKPPEKPIWKKGWFWGVIGGAVVVVAVVVPVAIIASSSSTPWATSSDFGPGAHALQVHW